jgi:peptidylprolyl isomerase
VIPRGGDDEEAPDLSDTSTKPVIEVSDDPPPEELVSEDIVTGEGPEVQVGDTIAVEYVGVVYETGAEFDSSWETPGPVPFNLSPGGLIDGWIQGVPGMRVGGRRKLTIPADLAYGPTGRPPDIPPDAALVFVIDLKRIQ